MDKQLPVTLVPTHPHRSIRTTRRDTMTYSLLTIHYTNADGTIDGAWLQDHVGTLQSARGKAAATSALNSGIQIAVVEKVGFCGPADVFHYRRRLA